VWFDITALLVSGAYKLADTVKKPPPITGDQAVKFANYFLSRRSVQTAKGAYNLLEVVNTLTNNKVLYDRCNNLFEP
jgi:oligosaccharyltransferase complex subunit delta (ribophorin II)